VERGDKAGGGSLRPLFYGSSPLLLLALEIFLMESSVLLPSHADTRGKKPGGIISVFFVTMVLFFRVTVF